MLKEVLSAFIVVDFCDTDIKYENNIFQWIGIGSFVIYDKYFHDPVKKIIIEEFSQKSLSLFPTMNCPEYLLAVQRLLKIEENRANSYYHERTKEPVMRIIEHELITKHA
jgi:hypothetical protein